MLLNSGVLLNPLACNELHTRYVIRSFFVMLRGSGRTLEEIAWLLEIAFLYKQPFALVHCVQKVKVRDSEYVLTPVYTSKSVAHYSRSLNQMLKLNPGFKYGNTVGCKQMALSCQVEKITTMF